MGVCVFPSLSFRSPFLSFSQSSVTDAPGSNVQYSRQQVLLPSSYIAAAAACCFSLKMVHSCTYVQGVEAQPLNPCCFSYDTNMYTRTEIDESERGARGVRDSGSPYVPYLRTPCTRMIHRRVVAVRGIVVNFYVSLCVELQHWSRSSRTINY